MKKLLASALAVIVFLSYIYIDLPWDASAKSTEAEVENAIKSAIQWKMENDDPFKSAGEESSNFYMMALVRGGFDFDYDMYLEEMTDSVSDIEASDSVLDIQKALLSVVAMGGNGEDYNGKNLIAESTYLREDLGKDNVLESIYALILLNSKNFDVPSVSTKINREKIISTILSKQRDSGSFKDVYTTACAIIALAPYNNEMEYEFVSDNGEIKYESGGDAINRALEFLSEQQSEYGEYYSSIDTAMVSMAMDAIDLNEDDSRFIKDNYSVMDGLLTYRNDDGGFSVDYNNTDNLATSYAMCAMVSNMLNRLDKVSFFDFTVTESLDIDLYEKNVVQTVKPVTKVTAKPSIKATVKPTKKPSSSGPEIVLKPKATVKPKVSIKPRITPKPKKKDLVGPVQLVGPKEPEQQMPLETILPDNEKEESNTVATVLSVVCVIAILLLAGVIVLNNQHKKAAANKAKQEEYKAKLHRKTEEHRKYENRRKYEERRKYRGNRR